MELDHRIACNAFHDDDLPDWINSLDNASVLCKSCHAEKTNLVFGDKWSVAKRKRQLKRGGQKKETKSKINSRGFDKTYRKKMNGKVEKR